ncbi:HXXEE domain-containing protein [Paenibacillus tepidiphilus]|uniref:HXXEE domain-containing protein n=1 Tax=Paenibacillus tepidiphilus TaxID=2608683 RepID=UPI00123BDA13|nr:HXXEE domain-containing protein [Paenibacillus tepidiphilus]
MLNAHVDLISLFWLLPVCFMFHDFEEILTIESWGNKHSGETADRLPEKLRNQYLGTLQMTTRNFAMDVLFVYMLIVSVTVLAVFFSFYLLFLSVLALFLLHVFTHLGQSILLRLYTPGVITAVLIALPYSLYAFYRLLLDGIVDGKDIGLALLLLLVLVPPAVLLLLRSRKRRHLSEKDSAMSALFSEKP